MVRKVKLFLCLMVTFFGAIFADDDGVFERFVESDRFGKLYLFHPASRNFDESKLWCESSGGQLVLPQSQPETEFLLNQMSIRNQKEFEDNRRTLSDRNRDETSSRRRKPLQIKATFWIGLSSAKTDLNGRSLIATNWASGLPSSKGLDPGHCVRADYEGRWITQKCDSSRRQYTICQKVIPNARAHIPLVISAPIRVSTSTTTTTTTAAPDEKVVDVEHEQVETLTTTESDSEETSSEHSVNPFGKTYIYNATDRDYHSGKSYCESLDGQLVLPKSQEEALYLFDRFRPTGDIWLGIPPSTDMIFDTDLDGNVLEWTNWMSGEPDGDVDQCYAVQMMVRSSHRGQWLIYTCNSDPDSHTICEFATEPISTTTVIAEEIETSTVAVVEELTLAFTETEVTDEPVTEESEEVVEDVAKVLSEEAVTHQPDSVTDIEQQLVILTQVVRQLADSIEQFKTEQLRKNDEIDCKLLEISQKLD